MMEICITKEKILLTKNKNDRFVFTKKSNDGILCLLMEVRIMNLC